MDDNFGKFMIRLLVGGLVGGLAMTYAVEPVMFLKFGLFTDGFQDVIRLLSIVVFFIGAVIGSFIAIKRAWVFGGILIFCGIAGVVVLFL